MESDGGTIGRRAFLAAGGALGLLALVPLPEIERLISAAAADGRGHFLAAAEMATLRAATARLIPGPPEDPDPGALEARCAEAIDLLLAAFSFDPPLIHAGGPFSGRAPRGAEGHHDDFAEFIPLDPLSELGWRIRIEGSLGRPEREFGGPVDGLQHVYRAGLAHLDSRARALGAANFATLGPVAQTIVMSDPTDSAAQGFVGTLLGHTLDAFYGPPEYGGNHGLAGWKPIGWAGDVQPRGFTAAQVSNPDPARKKSYRSIERLMWFVGKL